MPEVHGIRKVFANIIVGNGASDEISLKNYLDRARSVLQDDSNKNIDAEISKYFLDLCTQLICYGLFSAWMRFSVQSGSSPEKFTISSVPSHLQVGSLLRKMFSEFPFPSLNRAFDSCIKRLEEEFNNPANIAIAKRVGDLHNDFYSTFLTSYDPDTAKTLGVVYTDEVIVNFTIRGINHLLRQCFNKNQGILDPGVMYLDPASGTMAYPCGLLENVASRLSAMDEKDERSFEKWFRSAFLRRQQGWGNVVGFEVLITPYVLGHLRVMMMAERLGANINYGTDRVQLYLLNTLRDLPKNQTIEETISSLENTRSQVKIQDSSQKHDDRDVIVVMGNPPYNISSQNNADWILQLTDEYISPENLRREAGKPQVKQITGLKSMKDDYIKFLRFAQWMVTETNHQGIVALITNNFYLDGMVARGMRKELRRHFDSIYVVNLHGETRQKLPDRAKGTGIKKDEGVFDITVGTAIVFFIRSPTNNHKKHKKENPLACDVFYCEKFGTRKQKFEFLEGAGLDSTPFTAVNEPLDYELSPFVIEDETYNTFPYLCDIFLRNIQGIVTAHDTLVSHPSSSRLEKIIDNFYGETYTNFSPHEYTGHKSERVQGLKYRDPEVRFNDSRDWLIKDGLKGNPADAKACIIPWQFRGFDRRYLCYYAPLLNRGTERFALMQYLLPSQHNRALIVNKLSHKSESRWSNVFITDVPSDGGCMEGASSGGASYTFPLRINTSTDEDNFDHPKLAVHSNLNPAFMRRLPYWSWDDLSEKEKLAAGERVFNYIYGILYCPQYRELYGPILAKDFPRVPFPQIKSLFDQMASLGEKLASHHLLIDPATRNIQRHPINEAVSVRAIESYAWIEENDGIGKIWFDSQRASDSTDPDRKRRVLVPKTGAFYIDKVPKNVWTFEMGQIPQLDQWLGSRKHNAKPKKDTLSRDLNADELAYLLMMINAIEDTLALYPVLNATYQAIRNGEEKVTGTGKD